MSRKRLMQVWKRVERELRAALVILDQALPAEADRWADARDFVEHNEFGVAFDIIVDALLEVDARDDVRQALVHLERVHAEWRRVDHEDSWQMLRQRLS
jgi:hypothetical protein